MEDKIKKQRCPRCNSSFGYVKLKDKVWQCRSCGSQSPIDELKNKLKEKNKEE